jgi:RNA polymerase-binding transcription factor DksA
MASKKKAAKPAVKKAAAAPKKAVPAKKTPVAKKTTPKPKKAVTPAKPVVKKAVPPAVKKPATHTPSPVAKKPVTPPPSARLAKQAEPVKPVPVIAPAKPVIPGKPVFKPVTNTPIPVPKKTAPSEKPTKVVMPELNTKTAKKYQPDFTKSVLDQPYEQPTGPTMRYSDVDLAEFREIIQRKLDAAKKELNYLQGLITRKDDMGGDNDDARYMTMEDGSISMEREQLSQMASRQITFIDHLEKALMRIENKTYGICRVTGKLIDKARLKAVPHATLSIEAKQMQK